MKGKEHSKDTREDDLDWEQELGNNNQQSARVRRKIDDILEQKRLKRLIGDDDWE
jgi:hypothetical protein